MKKILILLIVLLFASCETIITKDLKSSKFELRQLIKATETTKSTSGYYFFVVAGYNSNEEKETYVKVFAKVENRFRLIEIPIKDLRINIDNSLKKPTLFIEYRDQNIYEDEKLISSDYINKIYVINCPEVYLPERLLPINL